MTTATLPTSDARARLHALSALDAEPRSFRRRQTTLNHLDAPLSVPVRRRHTETVAPVLADLDNQVLGLADAWSPFQEIAEERKQRIVEHAKRRHRENIVLGLLPPGRTFALLGYLGALYELLWQSGNPDHQLLGLGGVAIGLVIYTRSMIHAQHAHQLAEARVRVW
jgi:hypothetical protein